MNNNTINLFPTPLYRSTVHSDVDPDAAILDHVKVFIYEVLKISPANTPKIVGSWIVDQDKGQLNYTPSASMISGVLRTDNVQGNITVGLKRTRRFFDMATDPVYTESTLYNSTITTVDLAGGDIVLFPSGVSHSVYPSSIAGDVHTIAFEVFLEGKRHARARTGGPHGGHVMLINDDRSMWIED